MTEVRITRVDGLLAVGDVDAELEVGQAVGEVLTNNDSDLEVGQIVAEILCRVWPDPAIVPTLDIPVFDAAPDLAAGISHLMRWSTDIQESASRIKQRRALRSLPIHSVRFTPIAVEANESAHLAALFEEATSIGYRVPWWFDRQAIPETLPVGTDTVTISTVGYGYVANGEAIIWTSPFLWEVVDVLAVAPDEISISPTVNQWNLGSAIIMPLYVGYLLNAIETSRHYRDGFSGPVTFVCQP